ncbi:MAG: glucose-6-phosphate isomerase [Halobacteriovoraceae bacterium]|nr:glucose-6-phosphate isomerase [Halobacteriovoraceae bacterium]
MQIKFHSSIELTDSNFEKYFKRFKHLVEREDIGFFRLTDNQSLIDEVKSMADKFADRKNFIQVGIGGSALGPEMLVNALSPSNKNFYCFDNPDSDYLARLVEKINLEESLFYVVSKSGGTAETIACYSMLRNQLYAAGIKDLENYFVFCTDPSSGELRKHVDENQYDCLAVPSNIGGRFSVLSPVGLFPAYFMGLNIDELFAGANSIKANILNSDFHQNDLFKTAELVSQAYKKGIDQTVLMPYSTLMRSFSSWFVQLWAESLGKRKGDSSVGLTPIPAYGATDQHSQVQLFMEGPNNKLLFLVEILDRKNNFPLDSGLELSRGKKLSPFSMNDLIHAEFRGNLEALKENGRNLVEITIKNLDEKSMGAMIMFFESLTALMGEFLEIDAFNQPGVELGKKYTFEFLDSLSTQKV